MISEGRHIVITSRDTTIDIPGKGNARVCMASDVIDIMFMWDKIVPVQFVIIRLDTIGL